MSPVPIVVPESCRSASTPAAAPRWMVDPTRAPCEKCAIGTISRSLATTRFVTGLPVHDAHRRTRGAVEGEVGIDRRAAARADQDPQAEPPAIVVLAAHRASRAQGQHVLLQPRQQVLARRAERLVAAGARDAPLVERER